MIFSLILALCVSSTFAIVGDLIKDQIKDKIGDVLPGGNGGDNNGGNTGGFDLSQLTPLLQNLNNNNNGGGISLESIGGLVTQYLQNTGGNLGSLDLNSLSSVLGGMGIDLSNLNLSQIAQFVPAALGGTMGNAAPPGGPADPPPADPQPQPQPEPEPVPQPQPQPEPEPVPEPVPNAPKPNPPVEPKPEPQPEPEQPVPEPVQPEPEPAAPKPVPQLGPNGQPVNGNDNLFAEQPIASTSTDAAGGGLSDAALAGIIVVALLCCVLLGVMAFCIVTKYRSDQRERAYLYQEQQAQMAPSGGFQQWGTTTNTLPAQAPPRAYGGQPSHREQSSFPPRAYGQETQSLSPPPRAYGNQSQLGASGFSTSEIPSVNMQSSYTQRDASATAHDLPDLNGFALRAQGPSAAYGTANLQTAGSQTPVYGTQESAFGVGQFTCSECGKNYHYQSDLDSHMSMRHGF